MNHVAGLVVPHVMTASLIFNSLITYSIIGPVRKTEMAREAAALGSRSRARQQGAGMGRGVVPLHRRLHDAAFVLFLVANVGLILAIETQDLLFPAELYPKALRDVVDWHVRTTGDFLVRDKPPYFRALLLAEIFFQAPLCLLTAYAFIYGRAWGRITGLIYGVHTSTTLIPILADILAAKVETQNLLLAAYLPFLVIPLLLVIRLLPSANPFTETRAKRKKP